MIDKRLIHGLHVEAIRHAGLHEEHEPHVVFQTSTVDALLEGAFEGDMTFAELAQHGDLGLGTFDHLDGEMLCVDGEFLRADLNGDVSPVAPGRRTPFAVVTPFRPTIEVDLHEALDHAGLLRELGRSAPPASPSCSFRLDGHFAHIHARSVPRQEPPYRTLAEVAADQNEFEFEDIEGTMVGFRFPDYAEGLEVPGFHLHFVDAQRRRGGHVLSCRPTRIHVAIDHARDLHMELPEGVELPAPGAVSPSRSDLGAIESD